MFVVELVRQDITSPTNRNKALTAEHKVLLTLRFLATGKMQLCNGDDMGVSQPSISRAVTATMESLSSVRVVRQFISFPFTPHEITTRQEFFYQIARSISCMGWYRCDRWDAHKNYSAKSPRTRVCQPTSLP